MNSLSKLKYCEVENTAPFDWNEFLNRKDTSHDDLDTACGLAESWITCACGNQCAIIPRDEQGKPLDITLEVLGCDFCNDLHSALGESLNGNGERVREYLDEALATLQKIEHRSAELIQIMTDLPY